ncbi:MAG: hypothetical protein KDD14_04255 [Saprospiraceae bacterium]|nr:hypothetical protein [Saprospiraceae bacterium]
MHSFYCFSRSILLATFLIFAAGQLVVAQEITQADTAAWVIVYTSDGNEFTGQVISQDAKTVVLKTEHFGIITIQRDIITGIRPAKKTKVVNGRVWFENPYAPRYFVGSSAYGLRKGEGAYENSMLFLNQVSYGFSDQFSLGVGFAPFIIIDDELFPVWLMPKFSIPIEQDKFYIALGGMFGYEFNSYYDEADNTANFNAAYVQVTYGSRDNNFSAGVGVNFSHGSWSRSPVYSLAGTVRLAPRFGLLAESYFFKDYGDQVSIVALGTRFMGRRIAIDVGLALSVFEFDGAYPIPYATLHVPFGSVKN